MSRNEQLASANAPEGRKRNESLKTRLHDLQIRERLAVLHAGLYAGAEGRKGNNERVSDMEDSLSAIQHIEERLQEVDKLIKGGRSVSREQKQRADELILEMDTLLNSSGSMGDPSFPYFGEAAAEPEAAQPTASADTPPEVWDMFADVPPEPEPAIEEVWAMFGDTDTESETTPAEAAQSSEFIGTRSALIEARATFMQAEAEYRYRRGQYLSIKQMLAPSQELTPAQHDLLSTAEREYVESIDAYVAAFRAYRTKNPDVSKEELKELERAFITKCVNTFDADRAATASEVVYPQHRQRRRVVTRNQETKPPHKPLRAIAAGLFALFGIGYAAKETASHHTAAPTPAATTQRDIPTFTPPLEDPATIPVMAERVSLAEVAAESERAPAPRRARRSEVEPDPLPEAAPLVETSEEEELAEAAITETPGELPRF